MTGRFYLFTTADGSDDEEKDNFTQSPQETKNKSNDERPQGLQR